MDKASLAMLRGITTFWQQQSSLRACRTRQGVTGWLLIQPGSSCFTPQDCVSLPLDQAVLLVTTKSKSSKSTSSVPGNCFIWAGISPEQGQARVTQIWINLFLSLRCHSPSQAMLLLPEVCSVSCFSVHQSCSGNL